MCRIAQLQIMLLTVLPSIGMPGGTKGTEPVASMMSLAVTSPPTSTRPGKLYLMVWGPVSFADPTRMSCTSGRSAKPSLKP